MRTVLVEDPVRILVAQDLVMLNQIDVIHAEAAQRLVQLAHRLPLRSTVDLGHEKSLLAIAVAERLSHP